MNQESNITNSYYHMRRKNKCMSDESYHVVNITSESHSYEYTVIE